MYKKTDWIDYWPTNNKSVVIFRKEATVFMQGTCETFVAFLMFAEQDDAARQEVVILFSKHKNSRLLTAIGRKYLQNSMHQQTYQTGVYTLFFANVSPGYIE